MSSYIVVKVAAFDLLSTDVLICLQRPDSLLQKRSIQREAHKTNNFKAELLFRQFTKLLHRLDNGCIDQELAICQNASMDLLVVLYGLFLLYRVDLNSEML